jgi:hypothetical protein
MYKLRTGIFAWAGKVYIEERKGKKQSFYLSSVRLATQTGHGSRLGQCLVQVIIRHSQARARIPWLTWYIMGLWLSRRVSRNKSRHRDPMICDH